MRREPGFPASAAALRFGLAAVLVVGAASCQTLGGTGNAGADLAKSRASLSEARAKLDRAARDGDLQKVSSAMGEIGTQFDAIESKTTSMNLMDNETMKIQIATGRRTMTETDRWIQVNDAEAVRSQVAQLDPVLDQVDVLLDRAVKSSTPASGAP